MGSKAKLTWRRPKPTVVVEQAGEMDGEAFLKWARDTLEEFLELDERENPDKYRSDE